MRRLLVADVLIPAARLGTNDLGFDQNVIGTTDHHQMLDIVPADDDKLALTIEIEGIDDAEPHLPGATARHAEPPPESQAKDEKNEDGGDKNRHGCGYDHQPFVLDEKSVEGGHWPPILCFARRWENPSTPDWKTRGEG